MICSTDIPGWYVSAETNFRRLQLVTPQFCNNQTKTKCYYFRCNFQIPQLFTTAAMLHSQQIQMIWTQLSKKDAYQDTDLCSKIWAWHIWVSWSYQSPWHRSSSAVVLLLLWWLILSVVVVVVVTHSSLHNNSCCCCVQDWVKLTVIINSICTNNNHFTP